MLPRSDQVTLVLGTRPEIIKMSPLPGAFREAGMGCRIIHTGQHYDEALDRALFAELGMSLPDVELGVGSGPHGSQTGHMLKLIERDLMRSRPDWVVVQGDTNSTLAGALAAAKLGIPIAHVEAGLRCGDRRMPEEINRIIVDQLSDLLFAPTEHQAETLRSSGVPESRIHVTGNTVADVVKSVLDGGLGGPDRFGLQHQRYVFMTLHRQENVDVPGRLATILDGMDRVAKQFDLPVLFSVHPRTGMRIREGRLVVPSSVIPIAPVAYGDSLGLQASARLVMTDSGGLQEESCMLGVPCVTLRRTTERVETIALGANRLAGDTADSIACSAASALASESGWRNPYGEGDAARSVARAFRRVG